MKRIRRFVSYSHKAQTSNVDAWISLANSFRAAAEILDEEHDRIPSDSRPFVFNAALSLELLLKAILVKKIGNPERLNGTQLVLLMRQSTSSAR
jgi:HEPN domain-containing protein